MTGKEYDELVFRTESDFRSYTEWLFALADRINRAVDEKWPNLLKSRNATTNKEEELLPL